MGCNTDVPGFTPTTTAAAHITRRRWGGLKSWRKRDRQRPNARKSTVTQAAAACAHASTGLCRHRRHRRCHRPISIRSCSIQWRRGRRHHPKSIRSGSITFNRGLSRVTLAVAASLFYVAVPTRHGSKHSAPESLFCARCVYGVCARKKWLKALLGSSSTSAVLHFSSMGRGRRAALSCECCTQNDH